MGDPLSVTASIIAVVQLAGEIVEYLNKLKDGKEDRRRLRDEIFDLSVVLKRVQFRSDDQIIDDSVVEEFGGSGGAFERCQQTLTKLKSMVVEPHSVMAVVKWPFKKKEVDDLLLALQSFKSLFALALSNDILGISRQIRAGIQDLQRMMNELNIDRIEKKEHEETKRVTELIQWLSPLDFWPRHADALGKRQKDTGQWILEEDAFKQWLSGAEKPLLCYGIAGAGKSILASLMIDHLMGDYKATHPSTVIIFIYFNYKDPQQTLRNLLGSILGQIVDQLRDDGIPQPIQDFYNHRPLTALPLTQDYYDVLCEVLKSNQEVIIVLDALDECPYYDNTRQQFMRMMGSLSACVKLLATARPLEDIKEAFKQASNIEISARDEDLRAFIEARLDGQAFTSGGILDDQEFKEKITTTIVSKAKGMFLLAERHINKLSLQPNKRALKKALDTLPEDIFRTYEETIDRIKMKDEANVRIAQGVLRWIVCAGRPLSITEVQTALAALELEDDENELDADAITPRSHLVAICEGLVEIEEQSGIVRLIHYTAQEYFERCRDQMFPQADVEIAQTCTRYLCLEPFTSRVWTNYEIKTKLSENPLYEYACKSLVTHVELLCKNELQDVVNCLFANDKALLGAKQVRERYFPSMPEVGRFAPGQALTIAASWNLWKVVRYLADAGHPVVYFDKLLHSPLYYAVRDRNEEMVKYLLKKGQHVWNKEHNWNDSEHDEILFVAVLDRCSIGLIEALLLAGASAAPDTAPEAVILVAVERSDLDVARLLCEHGVSIDSACDLAKRIKRTDVVQYLETLQVKGLQTSHQTQVDGIASEGE